MPRLWGIWTRGKLQILERYLKEFATASKSVRERVYLDLFAGEEENVDRQTGEPIDGSPRIALRVADPPFTRTHFFERPANAARLGAQLRSEFPDRTIVMHAGDCNETITQALRQLNDVRWAPTFAFIDPNGPDCRWETLMQLADHRRGQKTKVEMWLLLPVALFVRTLPTDGTVVRQADAARITAMYGVDDWRHIYERRLAGAVEPADARDAYVNLMRWRLESELGYRWTHALEVKNQAGRPLYHMVFATDHDAGTRIMTHIYNLAMQEFPAMRQQARDWIREQANADQGRLFTGDEMAALLLARDTTAPPYRHEPALLPWWLA
jgi:three-Cys-motif partner protein